MHLCEEHNLVVQSLQKELRKSQEELQLWKKKYMTLQKQHNDLLQLLANKNVFQNLNLSIKNHHNQQNAFLQEKNNYSEQASMQLFQQEAYINSSVNKIQQKKSFQINLTNSFDQNKFPMACKKLSSFGYFGQYDNNNMSEGNELISPQRSPRFKQDEINDIDFFSIDQIQKNAQCLEYETNQTAQFGNCQNNKKKGLDLIEGYFILQKIENFRENIKNHKLWIRSANSDLFQKQKNLLQIIYRYTFRQQPLNPIEDDDYDSRINEIKYGTPYEELIYSFDNYQPNEEDKSKIIFKTIRKKYVHCLIRPEIIQIQGKIFETQIMYGFISPFPLRTFFQDLHRTLQQEIKFQIINSCKEIPQEVQISKQTRIEVISKLMENIFDKKAVDSTNIQNFPIKVKMQTKVSTLNLQIESQDAFKIVQRQSLQILLKKYDIMKLCKIIHYVLNQKQVILVSTSRKSLNEIFQIVRLMIKPFYWVFPIVYRYSDHFEPFLSSPLPLMIGIVFDFHFRNYKENKILMNNDFVTIFIEQNNPAQKESFFFFSSNKTKYTPTDLREIPSYEKDINFLFKYLTKPDKKSRSNQSQKIQKYVNRLKRLILTGSLDVQLSTFMIEFLDTQMAQSFKDLAHGSNKKIDQHEEYNEQFAMTK